MCVDSPELTNVLLWMFSFDSTFLSQLCVDILKSCKTDETENVLFSFNISLNLNTSLKLIGDLLMTVSVVDC